MVKDGMGGGQRADLLAADAKLLNKYKNKYYKRAKANQAWKRIAKITGLSGPTFKPPKNMKEALKRLTTP